MLWPCLLQKPSQHPSVKAHGQGQDFSSADDTDTDLDERHRAITAVADIVESIYWADSEEENGDTEEAQLRLSTKKAWKCIRFDI